MNTITEVNDRIKELSENKTISTNDVSDGYHTFKELYDHRIVLFIALARCYETAAWRTQKHSDGSSWDGWFVLGLFREKGSQITYHLPMSEWDKCIFALTIDRAFEFDGHSGADVLERIGAL